jgi:opacity protein-like surface antigen
MPRVEGEVFFRKNGIDKFRGEGLSLSADGDITSLSFMVNGLLDFDTRTVVTPYIGAGVGFAFLSLNDAEVRFFGIGERVADDDDAVFAYQLIAGIGITVARSTKLTLEYRYFATTDPEFKDVDGDKFESEYESHTFALGVRYYF